MIHKNSVVDNMTCGDVLLIAGQSEPNGKGYFHCPVHGDDHASARVQPSGKGWRCHACGAKGGLLHLAVALGLGTSFAEAAKYLEENRVRH
jgi:hypothetical protein